MMFLAKINAEDSFGLSSFRGRTTDPNILTKAECLAMLFSEENSLLDPAYVNEMPDPEYFKGRFILFFNKILNSVILSILRPSRKVLQKVPHQIHQN